MTTKVLEIQAQLAGAIRSGNTTLCAKHTYKLGKAKFRRSFEFADILAARKSVPPMQYIALSHQKVQDPKELITKQNDQPLKNNTRNSYPNSGILSKTLTPTKPPRL